MVSMPRWWALFSTCVIDSFDAAVIKTKSQPLRSVLLIFRISTCFPLIRLLEKIVLNCCSSFFEWYIQRLKAVLLFLYLFFGHSIRWVKFLINAAWTLTELIDLLSFLGAASELVQYESSNRQSRLKALLMLNIHLGRCFSFQIRPSTLWCLNLVISFSATCWCTFNPGKR